MILTWNIQSQSASGRSECILHLRKNGLWLKCRHYKVTKIDSYLADIVACIFWENIGQSKSTFEILAGICEWHRIVDLLRYDSASFWQLSRLNGLILRTWTLSRIHFIWSGSDPADREHLRSTDWPSAALIRRDCVSWGCDDEKIANNYITNLESGSDSFR